MMVKRLILIMKRMIINVINTAISRYSVFAPIFIVLLGIYKRDLMYIRYMLTKHKIDKACLHLLDISVFNRRIDFIKNLASSANKRTKFFIIYMQSGPSGLFAYVENCLAQIVYALGRGMIPVIDMQNYPSIYMKDGELGHVNIWERYFKQPCGYSLDDIYDKPKVYSTGRCFPSPEVFPVFIFKEQHDFPLHFALRCALHENFLKLSDDCSRYIEQEYRRLIKPGMRVLGVSCRGTDYINMRPSNHPIQPEVDCIINKVKDVLPEWDCDYIYVKAEEREVVKKFENAFPGMILTVSQRYYDDLDIDYSQTIVGEARFDRENDAYLNGLEYLTSVIILSRCTCAVMGCCTGAMAALYINGGKYENSYIYDLGFYP